MAQLILLVVAAAWLAVLIPPMLRSRVENQPNSSVTDFRRKLTKLQNTATPPRGSVRAMGRPLAQSPLYRPAAAGRPDRPQLRSGVTRQPTASELAAQAEADAIPASRAYANTATVPGQRQSDSTGGAPRFRTHGDPTGGQRRPSQDRQAQDRPASDRHAPAQQAAVRERPPVRRDDTRDNTASRGHHRPSTSGGSPSDSKRRRGNVLFLLVIITACTLFLAATTSSTVMLYLFALSFLGLCGYVYLLAQMRQRESSGYDGWIETY